MHTSVFSLFLASHPGMLQRGRLDHGDHGELRDGQSMESSGTAMARRAPGRPGHGEIGRCHFLYRNLQFSPSVIFLLRNSPYRWYWLKGGVVLNATSANTELYGLRWPLMNSDAYSVIVNCVLLCTMTKASNGLKFNDLRCILLFSFLLDFRWNQGHSW
jgi:hypothetical protein